jgi:hypothetical protein
VGGSKLPPAPILQILMAPHTCSTRTLPPLSLQATVVTMESNWERCLRGMLQYAAAHTCRRALLARHFGEAPPRCAAMCDCCKAVAAAAEAAGAGEAGGAATAAATAAAGGPAAKDVTEAARGVVQTLQGWPGQEKRATLIQLLDKWRGSKVCARAAGPVAGRKRCRNTMQHGAAWPPHGMPHLAWLGIPAPAHTRNPRAPSPAPPPCPSCPLHGTCCPTSPTLSPA